MTLPGTKDYDELALYAEYNPHIREMTKRLWEAFRSDQDEPHPVTHEINEAAR